MMDAGLPDPLGRRARRDCTFGAIRLCLDAQFGSAGLTEVGYAFGPAANSNGSAVAGLNVVPPRRPRSVVSMPKAPAQSCLHSARRFGGRRDTWTSRSVGVSGRTVRIHRPGYPRIGPRRCCWVDGESWTRDVQTGRRRSGPADDHGDAGSRSREQRPAELTTDPP